MISLLLLIPFFCISFSLYVLGLLDFIINNSFDIVLVTGSAFTSVVLSFFIIKNFICNNDHIASIMNLDKKSSIIHGYFSFFILFLFSISLIVNSFVFKYNMMNLIFGTMFIIAYIYITYEYIIKTETKVLKLVDIDDLDEDLNRLIFEINENEEAEYYVNKKTNYKKDKTYLCKINKSSKLINKVIKEVIELD